MDTASSTQSGYQTLISATALNELINCAQLQPQENGLVILDARFNLADPQAGRAAYESAHIPQAFYIHLDEQLSSPITAVSGRHPLPDFLQLAQFFVSLGITQHNQVVIYDDMGGAMAARCWWLLKLLNHSAVAVLDGGFPAWTKAGFPVTEEQPKRLKIQPLSQPPALNVSYLPVTTDQVLANLTLAEFMLVDARTTERYAGEQEPIDPVAGHIPGAVNRPLPDNLHAGLFKPAELLHHEWSTVLAGQAVVDVVHMCGSGVTACHNLLAMEHAGLFGAKVYAGSWSEWIRDPSRPVASC